MRNIWTIFTRDIRKIRTNVIALIVVLGVTVVPCLYAWYNIAASWDPYGNTGNLKVAVASVDEGYIGNLIPLQLNLGDQVLSALRENTQLNWVFTTKSKAMKGVKSGEYYAAIVIPEDFSTNLISVFSSDIKKPEITYYSNAKENAIAPKVTDKGATAVQTQVNEVFIETISDTVLTALQTVANTADSRDSDELAGTLITNLNKIGSDLSASSTTLHSFSQMTDSAQQLLDTTAEFLKATKEQASANADTLSGTQQSFSGIQETLDGATDGINTALTSTKSFYEQMSQTIDQAFQSQSQDASSVASTLDLLGNRVNAIVQSYQGIRDSIAQIADAHPELSDLTAPILAKLDDSIAVQGELRDKLTNAASSLRDTGADPDPVHRAGRPASRPAGTGGRKPAGVKLSCTGKKELDDLISSSISGITAVKSDYETNVSGSLKQLSGSLGSTKNDLSDLLSQLGASADGIYTLASSAGSDLSQIQKALETSSDLLETASKKITDTTSRLSQMEATGDFSELEDLISGDKNSISSFLAAPVELKTNKVYPIENYGSSMAPFYSTLSIWIGGIVLVAMLKVTVSENGTTGLKHLKLHQIYLGRYLIFLILGLLQSTLICLGDLFYLGIQCRHPFLFLLAGWISSIVYVNIIYTLTVSFGDIGKAISVVLLVMQVAGTGGTFPIEVAPRFFKAVYSLFPFTHSMAALREAVGGLYGMDYWIDLGKLCIFLVVFLIMGLMLRKPIIKVNEAFSEKLEETKIM